MDETEQGALVERLKNRARKAVIEAPLSDEYWYDFQAAADLIQSMQADNERMRESDEQAYQRGRAEGTDMLVAFLEQTKPQAVGDLTGRENEIKGMETAHSLILMSAAEFVRQEYKRLPVKVQLDPPRDARLAALATEDNTNAD